MPAAARSGFGKVKATKQQALPVPAALLDKVEPIINELGNGPRTTRELQEGANVARMARKRNQSIKNVRAIDPMLVSSDFGINANVDMSAITDLVSPSSNVARTCLA